MAQMISALVYNINGTDLSTPQTMAFPVASIMIRPAVVATVGATTMNATIQVLLSAPAVKHPQYHTNATVSALATSAG